VPSPLRAFVYVDGFNLYYRALKQARCNWLNLSSLAKKLLPAYDVVRIKYYTARIQPNPHDPDQHVRQQIYLRALATLPDVEIHFGSFLTVNRKMPDAVCWSHGAYRPVEVVKTEEKGSDVNLAAHLIRDGFKNEYDIAAVISNDTDLEEPIRIVSQELGKGVALLHPSHYPSGRLGAYATTTRRIRAGALRSSLFPTTLTDAVGQFHKPSSW
jgi:uncharacterized LabA/DUF88 family protein